MGKRFSTRLIVVSLLAVVSVAAVLALAPATARASGTPQAANAVINSYQAQLSGQIANDTLLGTNEQGYEIHYLTITTTLAPQGNNPPLAVRLDVSEAYFPGFDTQQQPDVLPGGATVTTTGFLRGSALVTNSSGTITLYVANTNGLILTDGSMHFDVEGTGTGKASGGKTSLYLTIAPPAGQDLTGQVTGSLDIPQAALDLITSTDPLVGPTVWYLLRASGLAALALLVVTVLVGLALRVRLWKETLERWRVYDIHLTASILLGVFLGLHLLLVFLDRVVPFSLADILIPFHDSYQPIWIAAGIVGLYLLLVVWGSSLFRSKLGYNLWRNLHPLALGALGLAMLHALFAGTDGPRFWLRAALVVIVIAVIWLFNRWMKVREIENSRRGRTGAPRQPQARRQGAPQPYPQAMYPPAAPTHRPRPAEPSWSGQRPSPGGQPRPRKVNQE